MYNKIMILYVEEKIDYFKAIPESRSKVNGEKYKDTILLQHKESPAS